MRRYPATPADEAQPTTEPARPPTTTSGDEGTGRSDDEREPAVDRRGFGSLLLAGAVGAAGLSGLSGTVTASTEWRGAYFGAAEELVPALYEQFITTEAVEAMLATEAETTAFFDVLGERTDLDAAVVTSATVDVEPCGGLPTPPIPRPWQLTVAEILEEIIEDMKDGGLIDCYPTYCERPDFLMVPVLSAHVGGPEGDAFVRIDPTGGSVGVFIDPAEWCWAAPDCDPRPPHWTDDGWDTGFEGRVDFDGHPVPVPA